MDFECIKKRIEQFKSKNTFEEAEYKKIFDDLDNLYKKKNNAIFKITSNEYILKEKEIFRKYIIGSLLQKSNEEAKTQKFKLALNNIKKLKSLNPSEKENKEIEKIKQYCEIRLNLVIGYDLINEKKYKQAITYFRNLKEISYNVIQNDFYNKGIELAKASYIGSIINDIVNLMQKEDKYREVVNICEKVFGEFKYDNFLRNKISDIKVKYYCQALEKVIEEKIKKNENFVNEMEKYKLLIDTENIKENKIAEFESKIKFSRFIKRKYENRKNKNLNIKSEKK